MNPQKTVEIYGKAQDVNLMNKSILSLICDVLSSSTVLIHLFSAVNLHSKVLRGGLI